MSERVVVRPARSGDVHALTRLDLTYDVSRVLALERAGSDGEPTFSLSWQTCETKVALYNEYSESRLEGAVARADLFLVAVVDEAVRGLLMVILPPWTDAGEISDLAIDRAVRGVGAGRALVDAAMDFARARPLRALWVEPRADNAAAIEFYLSLGFRVSGFNDRMYSNHDDEAGRTTLFMHLAT